MSGNVEAFNPSSLYESIFVSGKETAPKRPLEIQRSDPANCTAPPKQRESAGTIVKTVITEMCKPVFGVQSLTLSHNKVRCSQINAHLASQSFIEPARFKE